VRAVVPDVYLTIGEAEPAVVEGLVQILELRANDAQQREMRDAYFADIEFPADARASPRSAVARGPSLGRWHPYRVWER
jgi:hypothetical protein